MPLPRLCMRTSFNASSLSPPSSPSVACLCSKQWGYYCIALLNCSIATYALRHLCIFSSSLSRLCCCAHCVHVFDMFFTFFAILFENHHCDIRIIGLVPDHLDLFHLAQPHRQCRCLLPLTSSTLTIVGCTSTFYPRYSAHHNRCGGLLCSFLDC